MKKSWNRPCAWGYEVKVDRSDFINDNKWPQYLPYCNQFYFVCPPKLISVEELPSEVGLLYTSSTCTRLYTKKKAPHRDVEIPNKLFMYLLMARVKVVAEYRRKSSNLEFWRSYLRDKNEKLQIGYAASKKIRKEIEERVSKVESENAKLRRGIENFQEVERLCKELGLPIDHPWGMRYEFNRKIEQLSGGELIKVLDRAAEAIGEAKRKLVEHSASKAVQCDDGGPQ